MKRSSYRRAGLAAAGGLLMLGAGGSGVRAADEGAGPAAPVQIIAQGTQSAIDAPRQEFVRDAKAFQALWAAHTQGASPAPARPAVDLSSSTVVAIFEGNQPTGGYSLAVSSLDKTASGWELKLSLDQPGPNCVVSQELTQPWIMVLIPSQEQPINVTLDEIPRPCKP